MSANPTAHILKTIDALVGSYSSTVVPIFVNARSPTAVVSVGSGFILGINGQVVLVTALHVLQRIIGSRVHVANICGEAVDFGGLPCRKSSAQDIAVIPLPDAWRQANALESINALTFDASAEGWEKTELYVAMGYPSTRNKLDHRYGKYDRYCHSISLARSAQIPLKTQIPNPLVLDYDYKTAFDSNVKKMGMQPDLHGMSGGPCLQILRKMSADGIVHYKLSPIGVLTEWHQQDNAIIASQLAEIF